jgi:hypothetical protein
MTSLSTNTTYQNWHCAYCHGDLDAATTVIWDAKFGCDGSYTPIDLFDETIAEHLSFNPLTSEWNLNISLPTSDMESSNSNPGYIQGSTDNNNQETHYSCYLKFRAPAMKLPTRLCKTRVVRRCSDSWEDAEVKAQCEAYTARVCSGWNIYRNRHCLLCKHLDVWQPCSVYENIDVFAESIPALSVLLDWSRLKRGAYASSEIYDPLSRVCRKVFI